MYLDYLKLIYIFSQNIVGEYKIMTKDRQYFILLGNFPEFS